MTKNEYKAKIQDALRKSDKAVYRSLRLIFMNQTSDERASENTVWLNGVGFNGVDAEILSSFAKQVIAWEDNPETRRYPSPLSPKQLEIARRKMVRYWRQLMPFAKMKEEVSI